MADEAPVTETAATTDATTTDAAAAATVATDPLASTSLINAAGDDKSGDDAAGGDADKKDGEGEGKPEGEGAKEGDGEGEGEKAPAGAPEAYDLKAPEGQSFDAETFAAAEPVFRELNLSNEQAQKLVDVYAEKVMPTAQQAANQRVISEVIAQRKAWADEFHADPEIGGNKAEESLALAAKALDGLGYPKGSAYRNLLDESGLGNHPETIRAWARVGRAIGEDSFERGDTGAPQKKSDAELFYPDMKPAQ